jgi:hypothetical protein
MQARAAIFARQASNTLPNSNEAEMGVLGSILQSPLFPDSGATVFRLSGLSPDGTGASDLKPGVARQFFTFPYRTKSNQKGGRGI